jgi:hypothetical protein
MDGINFYVYDTEHSIEDYHKRREKAFFDDTGVSHEAKEFMAGGRTKMRPLVEVGPFCVFHIDEGDRSWFSVHETPFQVPLVALASQQQYKDLILFSSVEKGKHFPRFMHSNRYSEDGIYEMGSISVWGENGVRERI